MKLLNVNVFYNILKEGFFVQYNAFLSAATFDILEIITYHEQGSYNQGSNCHNNM
jgi:hypothetical protein